MTGCKGLFILDFFFFIDVIRVYMEFATRILSKINPRIP